MLWGGSLSHAGVLPCHNLLRFMKLPRCSEENDTNCITEFLWFLWLTASIPYCLRKVFTLPCKLNCDANPEMFPAMTDKLHTEVLWHRLCLHYVLVISSHPSIQTLYLLANTRYYTYSITVHLIIRQHQNSICKIKTTKISIKKTK